MMVKGGFKNGILIKQMVNVYPSGTVDALLMHKIYLMTKNIVNGYAKHQVGV